MDFILSLLGRVSLTRVGGGRGDQYTTNTKEFLYSMHAYHRHVKAFTDERYNTTMLTVNTAHVAGSFITQNND